MLSSLRASKRLALFALAAFTPSLLLAQLPLSRQADEYAIAGALSGDQVFAQSAITADGGYVVWQDNLTDGDGLGISARMLDKNLAGVRSSFRINEQGVGEQENPHLALLKDGSAVFVWQGGPLGFSKIYARFLKPDGTYATGDIQVNSGEGVRQRMPKVAALSDGSVAVVWSSYNQDGSLEGVFGQRLSGSGEKMGAEFQVAQTTALNQRDPAIAALREGRFVVVWVSERVKGVLEGRDETGRNPEGQAGRIPQYAVEVFGRVFDASGPVADEFKLSTLDYVCSMPTVAADDRGGFAAAWSVKVGSYDVQGVTMKSGWDVYARCYSDGGTPASAEVRLNERVVGDQLAPRLAPAAGGYLAVWTSKGQDGSGEGIVGRFLPASGEPKSPESIVNTTTYGPQQFPSISSDASGRCLVVWSSFSTGPTSYDVQAQRFALSQELLAPSKPFLSALSGSALSVTWPALDGFSVEKYEVYVDESKTPTSVTGNIWRLAGLAPGSVHSVRLLYVLTDGRRSPLSEAALGTTWGSDDNFDGLPDDWQRVNWGENPGKWPSANVDSDGDGATNLQEFLAGTDPKDARGVLRMSWTTTSLGSRLNWNTQQGFVYQVQISTNLTTWEDLGTPRFAPGLQDSIPAAVSEGQAAYRIIRLR